MAIDSYTVSLLHFNGIDGGTIFTDEKYKLWTAAGNAQIDTAYSRFGGSSGLFDGTGDYISSPDSADWYFDTGEMTIDFWFKSSQTTGVGQFVYQGNNVGDAATIAIMIRLNLGKFEFIPDYTAYPSHHVIQSSGSVADGNWHHAACVRSGTIFRAYIDGVEIGTAWDGSTYSMINSASSIFVGSMGTTYNFYNGWIDELRVSKGIARWTSNFNPYSAPYGSERRWIINNKNNRLNMHPVSLGFLL